jgi:AraC-like DNA-binding protein
MIIPFVRVMSRLGKEPSNPTLEDVGLSLDTLASPDRRISHRAAVALLKESIRVSGREDLGLLAAQAVEPSELELWEYVMRTQPNVGQAVESMCRLLILLHDGSRAEIEREGDTVTVRWNLEPGLEQLPAINEFAIGLTFVTWRRVLNLEDIAISEVLFPHPAPRDLERYQKFFRCTIRFNAPFLGMRFPAAVLDFPLPQADSVLAGVLDRHAQDLIARLPKPGLSHEVQQLVTEGLATSEIGAKHVADRLHMSCRTLNRRLKEEDTSFRDLVDQVRRQLALSYLSEKHLSISEVAFLLGFSTSNAFHKAFKRWTGTTAGAYRQNAVSPKDP